MGVLMTYGPEANANLLKNHTGQYEFHANMSRDAPWIMRRRNLSERTATLLLSLNISWRHLRKLYPRSVPILISEYISIGRKRILEPQTLLTVMIITV